jgi:hypothetical protein
MNTDTQIFRYFFPTVGADLRSAVGVYLNECPTSPFNINRGYFMVDRPNKPKTLVEETHSKLERKCAGLRNYEPPSKVSVYDKDHNFLRYEEPIEIPYSGFNGRRK